MKYTKVSFQIRPDTPVNREILIAYLSDLDFESFDEDKQFVHGYLPSAKFKASSTKTVLEGLPFQADLKTEEQPDVNWNKEWEKNYFQPVLINNNCLVRAPFHSDYPSAQYEIIINPNMAFGTGNHETTSLMIEHLQQLEVSKKMILDMGCGTGILGIFASLKGCQFVRAIDIDQWCIESTKENCQLNQIDNLSVELGDAHAIGLATYDIILANIQRNIILQDIETYFGALNESGFLVVSGFFRNDAPVIKQKAISLGLKPMQTMEKGNWTACSFKK